MGAYRLYRDRRGSTSVSLEAILGGCLLLGVAICIPAFASSSKRASTTFKDQVHTLSGQAGGSGGAETNASWDIGSSDVTARGTFGAFTTTAAWKEK